jgi:SAM-dependent methyltransferase
MPPPVHERRNSSVPRKLWHFFRDRSPGEIVAAVRAHGALRLAWNAVPGHWLDTRFDRRHGVRTAGSVYPHELDVVGGDRDDAHVYDTTPARTIRAVLRSSVADPAGRTFVDMGSGKGRVILLAAELPFERVVGVEFAPALHDIAVRNVASYRNDRRRCALIEPVLADAAGYELPPGPCVVHFFSPFGERVLRRVLANVARSYAAEPRAIEIVYVTDPDSYPIPFELFAALGILERRPGPRLPFDPARRFRLAGAVFATPEARSTRPPAVAVAPDDISVESEA